MAYSGLNSRSNKGLTISMESDAVISEFTAGENVSAEKFVYSPDGTSVFLGDSSSFQTAKVIGITISSATTGNNVKVLMFGENNLNTPSTVDVNCPDIYLTSMGNFSNTAVTTGFHVNLGTFLGVNKIKVNIDEPIEL